MDVKEMIIDVLLNELKQTKVGITRASATSSEMTVKHQLNSVLNSITELIEATEIELKKE